MHSAGHLRGGAGGRHPDRGHLSGGGADVSGRVSSHLLRHRLPAQILILVEKGMNIGRGKSMKIVIWKSPKVLSSLLRRVFGVKEEA